LTYARNGRILFLWLGLPSDHATYVKETYQMSTKSKKVLKSTVILQDVAGTSYDAGMSYTAAVEAVRKAFHDEGRKYDALRIDSIGGRIGSRFYASLDRETAIAKRKGIAGACKNGGTPKAGQAVRTVEEQDAFGAAATWFSRVCADAGVSNPEGRKKKSGGRKPGKGKGKPEAAPAPAAREPVSFTALTSKGKGKTVTVDHVVSREAASAGLLNLAALSLIHI
jgi:hypothetical protein